LVSVNKIDFSIQNDIVGLKMEKINGPRLERVSKPAIREVGRVKQDTARSVAGADISRSGGAAQGFIDRPFLTPHLKGPTDQF
jgi:hypothetical protein